MAGDSSRDCDPQREIEALKWALERSESRFRQMFNAAAVSLWEEDLSGLRQRLDELRVDGVVDVRQYCHDHPEFVEEARRLVEILDVNQYTVQLFHAESKEQLMDQWHHTFVEESHDPFVEMIVALVEGRPSFESERIAQALDHQRLHVQCSVQLPPSDDPKPIAIVSIVDLTEHELRRLFLQRALTAQEEERRRIARELHDEAGQSLASVVVGLQELQQVDDVSTARNLAVRLQELAEATLDEVGRLARGLHPYLLEDLGLAEALQRHMNEVFRFYGLVIDFQLIGIQPGGDADRAVATAVYRIVQEALTNVVRHAEAKKASVTLRWSPGRLRLVIEDDGKGFDLRLLERSTPARASGLGLQGIRERVELLGGTLTLASAPGSGTTLAITIPVGQPRNATARRSGRST